MNYEKRYNELIEAIKVMRDVNPSDEGLQNWVHDNVPELTESEDERIRKVLVEFFKSYKEQSTCGAETFNGISTDNILTWLEKQGGQNQWNPSNEQINALEHFVRSMGESGYVSPYDNDTKLIYSLLEQLKQL